MNTLIADGMRVESDSSDLRPLNSGYKVLEPQLVNCSSIDISPYPQS